MRPQARDPREAQLLSGRICPEGALPPPGAGEGTRAETRGSVTAGGCRVRAPASQPGALTSPLPVKAARVCPAVTRFLHQARLPGAASGSRDAHAAWLLCPCLGF